MTQAYESRVNYDPAKEAVGVVTLTVECHPKQVQAVIDFLVDVRDKAGVYAVDFEHDVRIPEVKANAPKVDYEVFEYTGAPLVGVILAVGENEGEVHAEPEIQPAGGAGDAVQVRDGEAAAGESATDLDAGEDGGVAGTAGEGGAGSVGGSPESESASET